MAIDTGDLVPRASGAASLGVEQVGLCGMTEDIRPFCHVHMNSGVWHDPRQGQSGVIRYDLNTSAFQASVDGGLTFDTLMTSGQIDTGHSMQRAYDGGNEIDAAPANGEAYQGVIVLEPTPDNDPAAGGAATWVDHLDPVEGFASYGFAVSGSPGSPHGSLTRIGSHWMHILASGAVGSPTNGMFFGYNNQFAGTPLIQTSGGLFVECVQGQMDFNTQQGGGTIQTRSGGAIKTEASGFISLIAFDGNIEMSANFNLFGQASNDCVLQASQDVQLSAFDGSGQLRYKFGPYQAWHVNPSTNGDTEGPLGDGFFPMPHSGQILQMILENGVGGGHSMQAAYDGGPRAITTGGNPVHFDGDTAYALRLDAAEQDHPHLLVSGVNELPNTGHLVPGALWMQAHSAGMEAQLVGGPEPSNRAEASARSLGIDTLFYTTGSGIVPLRAASGVSQFFNIASSASIDENGLVVPLNIETTPSTFYHVQSASGIQIFVPGQYKISYTAIIEKTTGNLAQAVEAELRMRDKWGQEFFYLGSQSVAIIRDSNNLNANTCNGQTLVDLHAGDSIVLWVEHKGAPPAGNSVRAQSRASNVIVEWIGPVAGGAITTQSA
ncbi:MAG: hypothetical protein K5880_14360 [Hydrogenophaga sp.]|uniref:hypothetical protein n=1 Tax=Hydrogenophaga sp. TaxID=1904254 RepID=UPI0026069215|nr:hypothetical protein [Hydrogenophaga sp.]MCV0439807.1 hypothetical protein [Hydrogenophaga sp.]